MTRLRTIAAAAALIALSVAPQAQAKVLRKGGFSINAPKRCALAAKPGSYTLRCPRSRMSIVALKTDLGAFEIAQSVLAAAGATLTKPANVNAFAVRVTGTNGRTGEVQFRTVKGGVAVVTLAPRGSAKTLSRADRGALKRALRSVRKVRFGSVASTTTSEQEPLLATKRYTTSDGGATAMVPDESGWQFGGSDGIVEGANPTRGWFAFGVTVFALKPAYCSYYMQFAPAGTACSDYLSAADAIEQVFPQFITTATITDVRVVSTVPGTEGAITSYGSSGMFEVRMTVNGKPWHGFFTAATDDDIDHGGSSYSGSWYLYYSMIAVPEGTDPAVGATLHETWKSWDASANRQQRLQAALVSQQQTAEIIQSASDYRRSVYDKVNYNWDQYIRGGEPQLLPVAPNVIGEGGTPLVQAPNGGLFDFAGNPFA